MQLLRPVTKAGIVLGGFGAAFVVAGVAVYIRQILTDGPEAQASSGMYAGGDMLLGMAVFGVLGLLPLGLALYWLRPVTRFWDVLVSAAVAYALTGPMALLLSGSLRASVGNWAILGDIRFVTMPVSALALGTCSLFAPSARLRWFLLGAAVLDAVLFAGVVLVRFVLPAGF